jgi:hypothetical protein
MVLLFDPLPVPALESLLNMQVDSAKDDLAQLHSVLIVPTNDTEVVRAFHLSFSSLSQIRASFRSSDSSSIFQYTTSDLLYSVLLVFNLSCARTNENIGQLTLGKPIPPDQSLLWMLCLPAQLDSARLQNGSMSSDLWTMFV